MLARRPIRHGENLSARYVRLERSLHGKTGCLTEMSDIASTSSALSSKAASATTAEHTGVEKRSNAFNAAPKAKKVTQRTFMGVVVPEKPIPPADDGMSLIFPSAYRTDYVHVLRMLHVWLCDLRL